jgi:hypothetical protein
MFNENEVHIKSISMEVTEKSNHNSQEINNSSFPFLCVLQMINPLILFLPNLYRVLCALCGFPLMCALGLTSEV